MRTLDFCRILRLLRLMIAEHLSFLWRDILWWWLKIFVGLPLRLILRTRSEGKKHFPPPGQPAILIGNHTNTLDPFILSLYVKRPICLVVTDDDFRYKVFRILLGWLKIIPTAKSTPDSVTMRTLIKAVKQGQIIGISPEGGRNWDGEVPPLDATIPRLVKKLRLSVICVKTRGAYLTWPRWTNRPRRGRIILEFSHLFENPAEIPDDVAEIARMIDEKLRYSELEDPEITKHVFGHPNVAEHLELRLWVCPQCRNFFVLESKGRHLYCRRCGARWEFRGNGTFVLKRLGEPAAPEARNFKRYIDWAHYNDAVTMPMLLDRKRKGRNPLVSLAARMWSSAIRTRNDRRFKVPEDGSASLTPDFRMVFTRTEDNKVLIDIPLAEMKGANVVWNQKFEFFQPQVAYRLAFYGQSAYFWHFLTKKLGEK